MRHENKIYTHRHSFKRRPEGYRVAAYFPLGFFYYKHLWGKACYETSTWIATEHLLLVCKEDVVLKVLTTQSGSTTPLPLQMLVFLWENCQYLAARNGDGISIMHSESTTMGIAGKCVIWTKSTSHVYDC